MHGTGSFARRCDCSTEYGLAIEWPYVREVEDRKAASISVASRSYRSVWLPTEGKRSGGSAIGVVTTYTVRVPVILAVARPTSRTFQTCHGRRSSVYRRPQVGHDRRIHNPQPSTSGGEQHPPHFRDPLWVQVPHRISPDTRITTLTLGSTPPPGGTSKSISSLHFFR